MTEETPDSPVLRALRLVVLVAIAAALVGAALVLFARQVGFVRGPLATLMALTPWIVVAGLCAAGVCALLRAWWLVGVALVIAALAGITVLPLLVASSAPDDADRLTVMSVNTLKGDAKAEAIVELARARDVDLLSVQELTPAMRDRLRRAGLDQQFRHAAVRADTGAAGTALWSRSPLREVTEWDGFVFNQVQASTTLGREAITIVASHPRPPSSRLSGPWAIEQRRFADKALALDGPVLLLGDLNATSDHPQIRRLQRAGFAESRDQAGAGPLFTFPEQSLPLLVAGLDRAMVRAPGWVATGADAVVIPGSDHRALVVEYAIPRA